MSNKKGSSIEQQKVERWVITTFSQKHGIQMCKAKLPIKPRGYIEIDGVCKVPKIFCEAWAHVGCPKSAQKHKIMTDVLKLIFANSLQKRKAKLFILVVDDEAAAYFRGDNWMAHCIRSYNIIIEVVKLTEKMRLGILRTQKEQYR